MRFPARLAASKLAGLLLLSIALLRSDAQMIDNDDVDEDEKCQGNAIFSVVYTVVIAFIACVIFGCVNLFQQWCCSFEASICVKEARAGTWMVFVHIADWASDCEPYLNLLV